MKTNTKGFSARDKRLMVGFGLFVEAVLCYMLLIDGPLGQIQKLQGQVATAQKALSTLQETVTSRTQAQAKQAALPPVLKVKRVESSSLILQDTLDALTRQSGATPIGTQLLKQEADRCQIRVQLEGSYEAISRFSHAIEHPTYLMGLDSLTLHPKQDQPDLLIAELLLTVPFQKE